MRRIALPAALATLAAGVLAANRPPHSPIPGTTQRASMRTNPLLAASSLPFEAPPFDKIQNDDYQPAFEEGMRQELAEMRAIADQTEPATFDNTIVKMERAGALLTRVNLVFNAVVGANTNDTLQHVLEVESPRLAAHADAIHLDPKLYARVRSLYERRASLHLRPDQLQLLDDTHRDFVRAGADLSAADQARLRDLNQEESRLSAAFQNKLLAATKAGAVVVTDSTQLAGLSREDVAAAADAARARGLSGAWLLTLQNTTQQPEQATLQNRALRQRLFEASTMRAEHGDSNDTRSVVAHLAQLRAEQARLLGYPDYASYALETQGAKTPKAALGLLTGLVAPAVEKARGEAADMQQLANRQGAGITLEPWDWQYYAEQVRKERYDLDEAAMKPYFELDHVLQDGVFYAANRMYGVTFKERHDIPVYQPDVRVFEVFDADGSPLGLFYCDYFKRDNKNGGAWMDNLVRQSRLLGTKPVVFNVANFTKPAPGQPALLTFDDVTAMFHEFGHALHGLFSNVEYPSQASPNVPRDFVEFPSQFNEHWALEPAVFAHYAKHYQTGAPMPADLVQKIQKARTFNQGFATTEYLAASLLDLDWHMLPADAPLQDVDAFEAASLRKFHIDMPLVPPRYRSTYFLHIWANGYAAGYYAYLWSEVLDDDTYAWFNEHGGMTRANGQRFRDMILSRGGTANAADLYRAFRGRDPVIGPLLEQRGLTAPAASKP